MVPSLHGVMCVCLFVFVWCGMRVRVRARARAVRGVDEACVLCKVHTHKYMQINKYIINW